MFWEDSFALQMLFPVNCVHPLELGECQLISEISVSIFILLFKAICISEFWNYFYFFFSSYFSFPPPALNLNVSFLRVITYTKLPIT